MRIFTSGLLAASAISLALLGSASAAPIGPKALIDEAVAQQVAVVCDRSGRCYETNRRRANSYGPRARSRSHRNARPAYRQGYRANRYEQRSPGVGIGVGPYGLGINIR